MGNILKARKVVLPTALLTAVFLAGCGSSAEPESEPPEATVTKTVTATVTATPDEQSEPDTTSEEVDAEESAADSAAPMDEFGSSEEEAEDDGPVDIEPGKALGLANFFQPSDDWKESRFDIADKSALPGISATVDSCYAGDGQELEMRLGGKFEKLKFSVGQANLSEATDQNVVVRVEGNNSQLEIYRVPFNKFQTFSIDVKRVNALSIEAFLDDDVEKCGGSVQAVLYDVTLH